MTIIHNTNHSFPPYTPPPQPIECIPTISMSPNAHYKTQRACWATCVTGLLTDKAISRYQKKAPEKLKKKHPRVKKISKLQALLESLL